MEYDILNIMVFNIVINIRPKSIIYIIYYRVQ